MAAKLARLLNDNLRIKGQEPKKNETTNPALGSALNWGYGIINYIPGCLGFSLPFLQQ